MAKYRNNKQRVTQEFFWEIPGDVPGYRTQPDPFQGIRSTPDEDYQLPPHLDTRQSGANNNARGFLLAGRSGNASDREQAAGDRAQAYDHAARTVVADADPGYRGQAPGSRAETAISDTDAGEDGLIGRRQPFNKWALLLLLLLASGLGVLGYHNYGDDSGASLAQDSGKQNVEEVAQAKVSKTPKIFELFLGKENKTPQSKLRVITHVVVKGDTLWDIAEEYVKDPFRYPELARLSKIRNPDLIYPYDLVRIHIYE